MGFNPYCPLGSDTNSNTKTIRAHEITGPCVGIYDKDKFDRDIQKVLKEHPNAKVNITKREYDALPTATIRKGID